MTDTKDIKRKVKRELQENGESDITLEDRKLHIVYDDVCKVAEVTVNDGMYEQTFDVSSLTEVCELIDELAERVL